MSGPAGDPAPVSPAGAVLSDALIRELTGYAVLLIFLACYSPAVRHRVQEAWWRLRKHVSRRQDAEDAAVLSLRRDISEWEHGPQQTA